MNPLSNSSSSSSKYRPDIDGLRAVAVLSIVIFHAFPKVIRGGFIGVDIFFVISGFLISRNVFEGLQSRTFTLGEFYSKRITRIFPSLILVVAATFIFGWFSLMPNELRQLGRHMAGGAVFVSNFVLWSESGYFDELGQTKPLHHLWSLGVEEQFYILWVIILFLCWKKRANLFLVTFLGALLSFCLNIFETERDPVAAFYSPLTRVWELLVGGLVAGVLIPTNKTKLRDVLQLPGLYQCLSGCGLICLGLSLFFINEKSAFPGYWALLPVMGTAMLIASGPMAWINQVILSNRTLVWIGLISYPFYLWHWPILTFPRIILGTEPNVESRILLILVSVFFSALTYQLVERPLRFGLKGKNRIIGLSLGMLVLGCLGLNTDFHKGYKFRSHIKPFLKKHGMLERIPARDVDCLFFIGNTAPNFPYCRLADIKANETIAVIGDSHAHSAFFGVAKLGNKKGKNVLLLANSGCPPIQGVGWASRDRDRRECEAKNEQILEILKKKKDISKVFIFTKENAYIKKNYSKVDFLEGLQKTIDELVNSGKKVFYVTQNPRLPFSIKSCLPRPLRKKVLECSQEKAVLMKKRKDWIQGFSVLKNVTVIDSFDAFCSGEKCQAFLKHKPLYSDRNHLSMKGSIYQAEKALFPFL